MRGCDRFRALAGVVLTTAVLAAAVGCEDVPAPAPAPTAPQPKLATGSIDFLRSFETARDRAVSEGKPLLLFFTATWCHYCHELADEVFTQPSVVNLSDRFVCVLVDADAQQQLCREFQVNRYPTVQFVSPAGMPLNRITGKKPAHQLIMEMQTALQTMAQRAQTDQVRR